MVEETGSSSTGNLFEQVGQCLQDSDSAYINVLHLVGMHHAQEALKQLKNLPTRVIKRTLNQQICQHRFFIIPHHPIILHSI